MLVAVFIITFLCAMVSVSGGSGIILMPSLLLCGYDIKEILFVTRVSAVIFILSNLIAAIHAKIGKNIRSIL